MRPLLRIAILGVAVVFATAWFGWWAVPVVGAAWGAVAAPPTRPALTVAAAAAVAWAALLAWTALLGPVTVVAGAVSAELGLPAWALVAATVLYPMCLAGAAASLVAAARG